MEAVGTNVCCFLFVISFLFITIEVNCQVQLGANINGEAADNALGYSVSISESGSFIATGAIFNDDTGTDAGQLRIYQFVNNNWTQTGSDIMGEGTSDFFGWSVAISANGTRVAASARDNDGNGTNSGHVRVFERSGNTWIQLGADIDGEAAFDESGYSIA
ncbi:MAG: FG-GAP repeat protein, partial [Cyanobacteria bacterium J06649_11]